MNAEIINTASTLVIAFSTSIGVLSTLVYYLANIKKFSAAITILSVLLYTIGIIFCIAYTKKETS